MPCWLQRHQLREHPLLFITLPQQRHLLRDWVQLHLQLPRWLQRHQLHRHAMLLYSLPQQRHMHCCRQRLQLHLPRRLGWANLRNL